MRTFYATEDGSIGKRGLVTAPLIQFLKKHGDDGVQMYACGPWAMMRAVDRLARDYSVPCEVSLEARMGCSLGACMGCVVQTSGDPSEAQYIRVCTDGPVVASRMINWEHPPL
jgi:dihydroorotate dehydrogenase electron transfer subunit